MFNKVKAVASNISRDIGYRSVRLKDSTSKYSKLKIQNSRFEIKDSKLKLKRRMYGIPVYD